MSVYKTHPEVLYGKYKDEEALSSEDIDKLVKLCIKECLTSGITAGKWLECCGYTRLDEIVALKLPYPENGSGDEQENYTNFLNDKVYLIFRKALEYRTHIKL